MDCTVDSKKPCKNNDSVKKKDWCYSCRTYTDKYIFYDFEATQNTGTHNVNLSIAQDFEGNEYIHTNIESFCKDLINDKFKVTSSSPTIARGTTVTSFCNG